MLHAMPPTIDAVDYSNSRPDLDALVKAGIRAVGRYLSPSTKANPGKHLTPSELVDLRERGLRVYLLWETTADDAKGGHDAGVKAANAAHAAAAALSLATNAVIYYAVDWDATSNEIRKEVAPYFGGIGEASPHVRIGGYGSYAVIAYLMGNAFIEFGFQTYAWSNGQWYAGAQLRQVHNGATIGGATVDEDEIMATYIGAIGEPTGDPTMGTEDQTAVDVWAYKPGWPGLIDESPLGMLNQVLLDVQGLPAAVAALRTQMTALAAKVDALSGGSTTPTTDATALGAIVSALAKIQGQLDALGNAPATDASAIVTALIATLQRGTTAAAA